MKRQDGKRQQTTTGNDLTETRTKLAVRLDQKPKEERVIFKRLIWQNGLEWLGVAKILYVLENGKKAYNHVAWNFEISSALSRSVALKLSNFKIRFRKPIGDSL